MNKNLRYSKQHYLVIKLFTEITKEPAQVTSFTQMNKSLDDCQIISQFKFENEANNDLNRRENNIQALKDMKQQSYEKYRVDNIVIINSQYVKGDFREPDMIYNRSIAYKCYEK